MYKVDNLSDKFVHRVAANESKFTIIYTPMGENLPFPITRQTFDKMFSCVRNLVDLCIIHRDLTPYHFMCKKDSANNIEKVFLIDFGSSVFIPVGQSLNTSRLEKQHYRYRGSLRFAASQILIELLKG